MYPFRSIATLLLLLTMVMAAPAWAQDDIFGDLDDPATTTTDSADLGLQDPADLQAQFEQIVQQAEQALQQGQYAEALEAFNQSLEMSRSFTPAHFGRGQALEGLGATEEAIAAYSQAVASVGIAAAPEYASVVPLAYLQRGKLYLETGRYREAVDDFSEATSLAPSNPEVFYNHGRGLLALTLASSSSGGIDQSAQRNLLLAVNSLQRAIELKNDYGVAYLSRGRVLARLREIDDAIEDLQQAVQLLGAGTDASAELGLAYIGRANVESSKPDGNSQQIVEDLRSGLQHMSRYLENATFGQQPKIWETVEPTRVVPRNVLLSRAEARISLAKEVSGDESTQLYQAAIADSDRILRMDTGQIEEGRAHFNRAHASRMLGRLDEAIVEFTAAIRTIPGYSEAYLRRGICYFHQEKYEAATQDFVTAAFNPTNPFQFEARAMLWKGLVHARLNEWQDAIQSYTRAVQTSPNYTTAYINRALAYMKMDRFDQAMEDLTEALRIQPKNEAAQRYLRLLEDMTGPYASAESS